MRELRGEAEEVAPFPPPRVGAGIAGIRHTVAKSIVPVVPSVARIRTVTRDRNLRAVGARFQGDDGIGGENGREDEDEEKGGDEFHDEFTYQILRDTKLQVAPVRMNLETFQYQNCIYRGAIHELRRSRGHDL